VLAISVLAELRNWKLVVVMVDAVIASLNVAVMGAVRLTPVAPLAGTIAVTVGGVVSAAAAVVNDHDLAAAMALPAVSVTPTLTVAV
jgi:hypothetical protein